MDSVKEIKPLLVKASQNTDRINIGVLKIKILYSHTNIRETPMILVRLQCHNYILSKQTIMFS